jgi:motility quorum-sensing regulator/GCU-specific mRNA interferase toxin
VHGLPVARRTHREGLTKFYGIHKIKGMEKSTPHYGLDDIKTVIAARGMKAFTITALRGVDALEITAQQALEAWRSHLNCAIGQETREVGAKNFSPLRLKKRWRWQGDAAGRKIFRPYEGAGVIRHIETDHCVWQDVCHALCPNGRMAYIKLTLRDDGVVVIPFKEP